MYELYKFWIIIFFSILGCGEIRHKYEPRNLTEELEIEKKKTKKAKEDLEKSKANLKKAEEEAEKDLNNSREKFKEEVKKSKEQEAFHKKELKNISIETILKLMNLIQKKDQVKALEIFDGLKSNIVNISVSSILGDFFAKGLMPPKSFLEKLEQEDIDSIIKILIEVLKNLDN